VEHLLSVRGRRSFAELSFAKFKIKNPLKIIIEADTNLVYKTFYWVIKTL
jgi:hypothetical protein